MLGQFLGRPRGISKPRHEEPGRHAIDVHIAGAQLPRQALGNIIIIVEDRAGQLSLASTDICSLPLLIIKAFTPATRPGRVDSGSY